MENFLLVNKPAGWTSYDVVGFIKKTLRKNNPELKKIKIGHAGTLDPFASGLLIIGIGREATKQLDKFKGLPKTYLATVHLGATSTTEDKDGVITPSNDKIPTIDEVAKTINELTGKQQQIPPMYSAKKVDGVRLYKLARKGQEIERKPSEIEVYSIGLKDYSYPLLKIEVKCSPGTYIRTLSKTIGEKLGTGAYCEELVRTQIGDYSLSSAKKPTV